jgi:tetratricopeptide (TPR) repeat protein
MRLRALVLLLAAPAAADAPSDAAAEHIKLAKDAQKAGLVEEAASECWAALRLVPDQADAKALLDQLGPIRIVAWDDATHGKFVGWSRRRAGVRKELAKKLAAAGQAEEKAGKAEEARKLWELAIAEDPDHAESRRKLGHAKADPVGWVPKEEADRRGKGQLPYKDQWLPAKEALAKRAKWDDAWEIRSAHFLVRTNSTEKEGVALAARCEELLHGIRRDVFGTVEPLASDRPWTVYYFATREDLDAHIASAHENKQFLKAMNGFHSPQDDISHFCPIEKGSLLTLDDLLRHEAGHHVIHRLHSSGIMNFKPGFWAWEGIACYFESLEVRDGKIVVGRGSFARFQAAKKEVEEGKAAPLAEFVAWDQNGLRDRYQQAAGLAHFLMHGGGGKWREGFLGYLTTVAKGEADAGSWEKAFGRKPAEMEGEWKTWMKGLK